MAIALCAVMVLSVAGIGFAAGTVPDVGMGSEPGRSSSLVTVEVSQVAPVNVSATVPIVIPLVVQGNSSATTEAPKTFWPTSGVTITNTTSGGDETWTAEQQAKAYKIKVDKMIARIANPGAANAWGLNDAIDPSAASAGEKNQMLLTMGGATFGTLASTSSGTVGVVPTDQALLEIEKDGVAPISIDAQAGGLAKDYTVDGKTNAFKIEIVISQFDASDPTTP